MDQEREINGIRFLLNDNGVHIFTSKGLITVTAHAHGIALNSRDFASGLLITKYSPHLASVEIVNNR